jgi:hypothetical protein
MAAGEFPTHENLPGVFELAADSGKGTSLSIVLNRKLNRKSCKMNGVK